MKPILTLPIALLFVAVDPKVADAAVAASTSWYDRSFFLLHLDHHTTDKMEVGRDADPAETARLINLVKPDVIQIHAKGNPGWTTYPTKIGHTPPRLARDVMQVWADLARGNGYVFSAYYNLGRDREIMRRRPEWNRVGPDGRPQDNALCYHSGVAEGYLWPMIDEIMERYRPAGFWFDGSCFTVRNCYCAACETRFRRERSLPPPRHARQPGWAEYKEMQREIYREFCAQTAARIKRRAPACLVAINWAYALRMPEEPPPGVDYFTGDHGSLIDELAPDAIWYDSQGRPFDLMTTVFFQTAQGSRSKPRLQLEQELAIIISHGGRYFAWDNPTPESGLRPERYELMAQVVAPFLRARQVWCLGSRALPEVSLFHGAAAHYAETAVNPAAFPRQNPPLLAALEGLRHLHLAPELISDRRLAAGDIRGRLFVLEDSAVLTDRNRRALRVWVEQGGRLLLTGRAIAAAGLLDPPALARAGLSRQALGRGEVLWHKLPLFSAAPGQPAPDAAAVLAQALPAQERRLTTDATATFEVLLREKDDATIVHAVNLAPGRRERDPEALSFVNLHVADLPPAPPCRVSVRVARRPAVVTLQPQNQVVKDWTWGEGRLELMLPAFETHQMNVIQLPSTRHVHAKRRVDGG